MGFRRLQQFAFHVALLVLIMVLVAVGTGTQATAQTEDAPTSTATLDPAGLDPASMTTFVSKSNSFEFQLPRGWETSLESPRGITVTYGDQMAFVFFAGSAKELLQLPADVDSPQAALDSWIKNVAPTQNAKNISAPFAVKTSQYEGVGVTYTISSERYPSTHWEAWILGLTHDKVAVLEMGALDDATWEKAKPIFDKMSNSLILRPEAINTHTPTPTATPTPDATLAAVLDTPTTETYKSPDKVFELQLPTSWRGGNPFETHPTKGLGYVFSVRTSSGEPISLSVEVGTDKDIYSNYQITTNVANPREALEVLKTFTKTLTSSDIYPVKIGSLDGYGITFTVISKAPLSLATDSAETPTPAPTPSSADRTHGEFWIASLGGDQVVVVSFDTTEAIWPAAQPVLQKIAGSVIVYPENIPAAMAALTATAPSN